MKTTNPSLIKRYFKGELEPGDHSKDFTVSPQYHLLFTGRIPYAAKRRRVEPPAVVTKHPDGGFVYWFNLKTEHPAHILLKGKLPDGIHTQDSSTTTMQNLYTAFYTVISAPTQQHVDAHLPILNKRLEDGEEFIDKLWELIDFNKAAFSVLWEGSKLDLSEISPLMAAGIMQRKMGG